MLFYRKERMDATKLQEKAAFLYPFLINQASHEGSQMWKDTYPSLKDVHSNKKRFKSGRRTIK
jgi:hypothetical protein